MSIVKFYTNHEIFITGGSGFIGKATIEKLLRDIPNIGKIYVLVRNKKGKSADERLQEILQGSQFSCARDKHPEAFKKVFAIAGDCQEIGLGISSEDLKKMRNVTMVFHMAASVRFDDHLKTSILLNVRGTHELLKVAETLPNLKVFLHVSTTYSHPEQITLEEKVYPARLDWRTSIELAETYDAEVLDIFFPKISVNYPNTYTFTKSMAENIIDDYRHKLPVVMFRPSIIIASVEEPFPGWTDNFNGPTGLLTACAAGILRTNYGAPETAPDLMPVDLCTKAILVTTYKSITQPACDGELEVINCSNSSICCMSIGDMIKLGRKMISENPFEKCIWFPGGSITRCKIWHYIRLLLFQLFPAALLDGLLMLTKHNPFFMKMQRRIFTTSAALYIFMNTEWLFVNERLKALENLIPEEEKNMFSILRYANYDPLHYYVNSLKGVKQFLLNEKPEATPQAHLRMKILRILHYGVNTIWTYYIVRALSRYVSLFL